MKRIDIKGLLTCVPLALSLCLLLPAATVLAAPPMARAYAPEDLRTLSHNDQVRVITQEYSEQSNGRRIPDDQLRFYTDQVNRSNWTFSRIKQDISQSLGGNGGAYPQPPVAGDTIRCESNDSRQRSCNTPWRAQSRMVRQLSSSACVQGRSWGSQHGSVWVSGGCRAEFAAARQVQPLPPVSNYRVTCGSDDKRFKTCGWNASYGRPQLSRQLSKSSCVSGSTWGYDGRGLWVDRGCRAEFSAQRGSIAPGNGYSVTCASTNKKQTTCAWDERYGRPHIIERLSGIGCDEGRTWGYQNGVLWVAAGCRARFGAQ
ncbi:MAG: DUF3011 domain-containing protein [Luteimonas sp.]